MDYMCKYNHGVSCPTNQKGFEYECEIECRTCGWNPKVFKERRAKAVAKFRDKNGKSVQLKTKGVAVQQDDYTPTLMTVKITTDSYGSSLTLTDERIGLSFMVPLDAVQELEAKNGRL